MLCIALLHPARHFLAVLCFALSQSVGSASLSFGLPYHALLCSAWPCSESLSSAQHSIGMVCSPFLCPVPSRQTPLCLSLPFSLFWPQQIMPEATNSPFQIHPSKQAKDPKSHPFQWIHSSYSSATPNRMLVQSIENPIHASPCCSEFTYFPATFLFFCCLSFLCSFLRLRLPPASSLSHIHEVACLRSMRRRFICIPYHLPFVS